jgi:hypothetical protein
MFPNFKSKADREQKHQDLLAKVERRNRQADVKRGLYVVAIWASEGDKAVSVAKSTPQTEMTQLDPLKKTHLPLIEGFISAQTIEPSELTP